MMFLNSSNKIFSVSLLKETFLPSTKKESRNSRAISLIKTSTKAKKAIQQKPSLLLVEDSLIIQKVHSEYLLTENYSVDVASNCAQAINLFHKNTYSLALLDAELPDGSGFDVATQIRAIEEQSGKPNRIPLILLSTNKLHYLQRKSRKVGINECASKPISKKALQAMVAHWLDKPIKKTLPQHSFLSHHHQALLIHFDNYFAHVLKKDLEKSFFKVDVVNSIGELLMKFFHGYDFVLLDIDSAEEKSLKIIQVINDRAKKLSVEIPVFCLHHHSFSTLPEQLKKQSITAFIQKPFLLDDVYLEIERELLKSGVIGTTKNK